MAGKTVGQLREALEKVSKRRGFGDSADKDREAKGPNKISSCSGKYKVPAKEATQDQEPDRIEVERQCIHQVTSDENQATVKNWRFVGVIGPPAIHKCRHQCSQGHGPNDHPTQRAWSIKHLCILI